MSSYSPDSLLDKYSKPAIEWPACPGTVRDQPYRVNRDEAGMLKCQFGPASSKAATRLAFSWVADWGEKLKEEKGTFFEDIVLLVLVHVDISGRPVYYNESRVSQPLCPIDSIHCWMRHPCRFTRRPILDRQTCRLANGSDHICEWFS